MVHLLLSNVFINILLLLTFSERQLIKTQETVQESMK